MLCYLISQKVMMKVCQIQCSLNTLKNTINYYQKSITFQSFLFRIHTDFIISEIMNINTSKDYKQKHCVFPDLKIYCSYVRLCLNLYRHLYHMHIQECILFLISIKANRTTRAYFDLIKIRVIIKDRAMNQYEPAYIT